jgi:hypothetical protein
MDPVERVKNMVRHTLVVKPDVSNRELMARAKEIAPEAVEGLSLRQFHGRFRLPVVRFEMTPKQRAKKNGGTTKSSAAAEATPSRNGTAKADPASVKKAPGRSRKGRKKQAAEAAAIIDSNVRSVLVDFAVELEKAESRSELVTVMAGIDDYVKRIVDAAEDAWAGSRRSAA